MMRFLQWLAADIPLKVTALLLSLLVWAYAALDRTYTVALAVPVVLTKTDTRQILVAVEPSEATVTLSGRGKDLVNLRPKQLRFLLGRVESRLGRKQVKLTAAELNLPPGVTLAAIEPEYVELHVNEASVRTVPVQVPFKGQPASNTMVTVNRPPATVRLLGPESELRTITSVNTETLDLARISGPGTVRLRVVPPAPALVTEPESVDIAVVIEKEAARIFLGVPVRVVGPAGRQVEIEPNEAQIAIAGPAHSIDSLQSEQITAQVKVAGLGPGDYRLAADILLPPGFRVVKCEPQLFDVTVR